MDPLPKCSLKLPTPAASSFTAALMAHLVKYTNAKRGDQNETSPENSLHLG